MSVEQRRGEKTAEQRADDADDRRDDEPTWVVTGQQRLRDGAGEQPENDECDDSHETSCSGSVRCRVEMPDVQTPKPVKVGLGLLERQPRDQTRAASGRALDRQL